jgi:flagellar motor switch protein FliN/FliY
MINTEVVGQPSGDRPVSDTGLLASDPFEPTSLPVNGPNGSASAMGPLSLLHDVDMEVTVELGRTTMPIRDLLALQPGMVVEINRMAGTPIDVLVNGRPIARGEIVVIDEEFGIRITEIVAAGTSS